MAHQDDDPQADDSSPDLQAAATDTDKESVEADVAEVRAALAADDDDLLEPDVFGDEDEDAVAAPQARRRLGLAPALLLAGGGVWAAAAVMRCSPADGPTATIEAADKDEPEAAPAKSKPKGKPQGTKDTPPQAPAKPVLPKADEPDEPDPLPEDWAKDVTAPELVTYKVRHGGSIKNVANLFKIFHHEIVELNPGVGLDQQLPPGSSVVVYRRQPGTVSQSVGVASGGTLEGGVPMLDGPGRVLKMIPWKGWATADTVATLDRVLRRWAADESNSQAVLVGNMSARHGGRLKPHSTHQSGRDVDLGYMQKLPAGEELNWRSMTADNLDPAATWKLLQLLRATGKLEVVFIDTKIQKLLHAWALDKGGMSKSSLRRWMEYPRSGPVRSAIIQHVAGHTDHLHARFKCGSSETRCKSRKR